MLDDDLPELTEGLVSLLWPHYLRTIPSMSVVEFTPAARALLTNRPGVHLETFDNTHLLFHFAPVRGELWWNSPRTGAK
jgi:hypothetical protein